MKVLQLNIWSGRLGKPLVDLLNKEDADIVCLQEVMKIPGDRSVFFTTIDQIAERTGYDHVFYSPSIEINLMRRKAQMGLCILSKKPFQNTHDFFVRDDFKTDFDFISDDYNNRNVQHVEITHDDSPLHILNYHGHHVKEHKNGNEETMRQCGLIVDYINKLEGNAILCGDLNLSPESESVKKIEGIMTNHVITSEATTTRNIYTPKSEICDYIFTTPDLDVKDFKVLDDVVSDHQALTVEF